MKASIISLVEERDDGQQPEQTFELKVIKVGRDGNECQVLFDQDECPIVSRKHAELRHEGARLILVDADPSFGTYLDGKRITKPIEVGAGHASNLAPESRSSAWRTSNKYQLAIYREEMR